MNKAMFKVRELEKWYEDRRVLNIKDLTITKGEILAIVGPSGAGKSTFLRLLNFLELPTKGTIQFDQNNPSKTLSLKQRRRITTVFQHPLLLKRNVISNLKYGLSLHGKEYDHYQVMAHLDRLGLTALEKHPAQKLSAGEAQRVALARALLIEPQVLLLDEPTSNLDPYNINLIESIVLEENQQNKTTIVIVTHNIIQAQRISHCTLLLLDGNLVEITDTPTFFSNPKHPQTQAFIRGEMIY
jgi:tungstate transport system ATP-binding protein